MFRPKLQLQRDVVRGRSSESVRCTSSPRFHPRAPVSVVRCEEDPYACGTSGLENRKHVRYAVDRFCYLLYKRPQDATFGDKVVIGIDYQKSRQVLFEHWRTHREVLHICRRWAVERKMSRVRPSRIGARCHRRKGLAVAAPRLASPCLV